MPVCMYMYACVYHCMCLSVTWMHVCVHVCMFVHMCMYTCMDAIRMSILIVLNTKNTHCKH